MATGQAKTKIVNGQRVDVTTGKPFDGTFKPVEPIKVTDLNAEVTPFKTQPQPQATQAEGMLASFEEQTDSYFKDLDRSRSEAEKGRNTSLEEYINSLSNVEGETRLTSKAYAKTVDPLEQELNDINNQILQEQHANRRRIEALAKNPQGLETSALNAEIERTNRESLQKQADLSIVQMARQGRFDSAKAIADRAVQAQLESQTLKLNTLKTIYEENKELFTTAEKREFEAKQSEREMKLQMEAYKEKARFDQIIKENDPKYIAELNKIRSEIEGGSINITNPNAGIYGPALNVILGSGKFTKDQKASLITAINMGEDPFTVIKNQAKNILGGTGETTLTKYETAQSAMRDLQGQLSDFYAKGGTTDIFKGNYEKVLNKLGTVEEPELVDLATQIAASLQVYRNAVSGTAYSEQEGQDIAAIFPGINKTEGLNKAIISGRMKAFDSTIDSTYRTVLGSTYDELKSINQKGVKGELSNEDFVATVLQSIGASYDEIISKIPNGYRAVIDNKTGQVGYIPNGEFDSKLYTSL